MWNNSWNVWVLFLKYYCSFLVYYIQQKNKEQNKKNGNTLSLFQKIQKQQKGNTLCYVRKFKKTKKKRSKNQIIICIIKILSIFGHKDI